MVKLAGWQGDEILERPLGARAPLTVGRDEDCALRVESSQVSRHHCRIEPLPGGRLRLTDLGSKNGTYLNGRRIAAGELSPYDVVRVGDIELVCLPDDDDSRRALDARTSRPPAPPRRERPGGTRQTDEDLLRIALRERLFQLALTSKDVVSDGEVRQLLRALLREAMAFSGAEWGAIYLTEDGPAGMEPEVALPTLAPGAPPEILRSLFESALRTRRTSLRGFCAAPLPGHPREPAAGSVLCVPLDTLAGLGGWRFDAEQGPLQVEEGDAPAPGTDPPRAPEEAAGTGTSGTGALVLVAARGLDALSDSDRHMLEAIAGQAAAVVQRAWLYRHATIDTVTQLTNRAWTERVLGEELRRMRVRRGPLSVLVMDLDHFKKVNDGYGHPAGDAVLRAVARRVRAALREGDLVGRWGGDELLVALAGVSSEGARIAAEKVARAVKEPPIVVGARRASARLGAAPETAARPSSSRRVKVEAQAAPEEALADAVALPGAADAAEGGPPAERGTPIRITLSLGVATYPEHGATAEVLVRHADRALYAAKSRGRDQVAIYTPELDVAAQLSTDLVVDVTEAHVAETADSPLSLHGGSIAPIPLPEQAVVTIGRSRSCDVVLDHPDVSPLHATITGTGVARLVEDRASIGGTHLNGRRLTAPAPLGPGDVLTIGPHDLRVVAEERSREPDPEPVPVRLPRGATRPRLLLVDDDPELRAAIETLLEDYDVTPVRTVAEAMQALRPGGTMAAVLAADHPSDGEGAAVLDAMQHLAPGSTRILLAGDTLDPAVEAVAEGHRHQVVGKPVDPADLLLAHERLSAVEEGVRLRDDASGPETRTSERPEPGEATEGAPAVEPEPARGDDLADPA